MPNKGQFTAADLDQDSPKPAGSYTDTDVDSQEVPHKSFLQSLTAPQDTHDLSTAGNNIINRAASTAFSPLLHPIDTAKNIGQTALGLINHPNPYDIENPLTQMVGNRIQEYQNEKDPILAQQNLAGDVLGNYAGNEVSSGLGKGIAKIGNAARGGAAELGNMAIGTTAGDRAYGANPGKAISENRIVGMSPSSVSSQVESLIPGAAAEHRGIVGSAPEGTLINTGPAINDPFNAQRANLTNPRTGAVSTAQLRRNNSTQGLLTNVVDPSTGKPTPMMKDPNLTPLEATDLKSNLYGMTNYEPSGDSSVANSSLKSAAHNLKTAVGEAIPESIPSGQRLHNLMSAKDVLAPSARSSGLDVSKSGLFKNAATLGTTAGSAGLDLLGTGAQNAAPAINMIAPPVARTSLFANARQRTQDQ